MTVSIQISPETEAQLVSNARAKGLSLEEYLKKMLEDQLRIEPAPAAPLKSCYGILAKYGPAPSAQDIDANRAEMLHGFAAGGEEFQG